MKKEVLQLAASRENICWQCSQQIVRQVDALDRGHLEYLAVPQCDECVRVDLLEMITFQVNQLQIGEAVESLWVDELDVVVVHLESL